MNEEEWQAHLAELEQLEPDWLGVWAVSVAVGIPLFEWFAFWLTVGR
jgi:hypothetical protein